MEDGEHIALLPKLKSYSFDTIPYTELTWAVVGLSTNVVLTYTDILSISNSYISALPYYES